MEDYLKNLVFNLLYGGYKLYNSNYSFDLRTSKSLNFYKIEGNGSFVFFNIIKSSEIEKPAFDEQQDKILEYLEKSVKGELKNIFFITLAIDDNDVGIVEKYSLEPKAFDPQEIYSVYWWINVNDKKFFCAENQPSKLFDLQNIIMESFNNKSLINDIEPKTAEIQTIVEEYSLVKEKGCDPDITYLLIALNVIFFGFIELNGGTSSTANLLKMGGFNALSILEMGEYYRFLTSCFIHIGISHLVYNLFALYIFGTICEKQLGHALYFVVYMATGFFAHIATLLFVPDYIVSAGASGCIYGLIGCIGGISLISRSDIRGISFHSFAAYIAITVAMGVFDTRLNNAAHIGGALSGLVCGIIIALVRKSMLQRAA